MKNLYNIFRASVKDITRYYLLLVGETKSQRLVGSTNEWVLDNYYMISEQEKMMKPELKGVESGKWKVEKNRVETLWKLLENYLRKCHYQVDKPLLFRYLSQVQVSQKDFLSYPEAYALLPILKTILISELAALCRRLEEQKAYHYQPTDKSQADMEHLNRAAQDNLLMMNIFNSLKKMTKLPMAELIDAVSYSERMLKAEKAGMYDQMQDKTKEDYRGQVVRLTRRKGRTAEYDLVKELVARADERGEQVLPREGGHDVEQDGDKGICSPLTRLTAPRTPSGVSKSACCFSCGLGDEVIGPDLERNLQMRISFQIPLAFPAHV